MILFFKIFFLIFFHTSFVDSFDVRVLLHRFIPDQDSKIICSIGSQHGMYLAGIDKSFISNLTICYENQSFSCDGITIHKPFLSIVPALPMDYIKKIHQFIARWRKDHHAIYYEQLQRLNDFYTNFVTLPDFKDYAPLYSSLQLSIHDCLQLFIQDIEHPVVSYQSLVKRADDALRMQLKVLLVTKIQEKKLSSHEIELLKQSQQARTDFFIEILEQIIIDFLEQFLPSLPHKIIHQAMREDTGCLLFDKNRYKGSFELVPDGKDLLLINSLDIDDYLLSVIFSEGWPGWPLEVNKALVIASRTYVVDKILQANKQKKPYHIVNSIQHQTYKGHHAYMKLKQAVDATRNIFLAYQGKPIVAMFDSCCGGVVPANIAGYDFKKSPYLARSKSCTYCKKQWIYAWKKELSKIELTELLRQEYPEISEIIDMKVAKIDPAGLVQQVYVTTKQQNFYISGKKLYSLFPFVKSFCYTIKRKGKIFIFNGKGYGHHMGLCQWGALGMVQDGWNYRSILQFYYPGIEFMKLSLVR